MPAAPESVEPGAVAVIGIGCMGLPMALRLRERGRHVVVHDIDAARPALAVGCTAVPTAMAAAASAGLVIVAVVDGAQTREVLFGPAGVVRARASRPAQAEPLAVLLCPTLGVQDVEDAARRLQAEGIDLIDAPMSGGPARAREGRISLMVAGDPARVERWSAVLHDLADPVFRVGTRAGDGARTKLVNNLLAAVNLAGAAEALALAGRMGLDPAGTLAVIERSSGQSWIASDRLRRHLAGDAEPRARMTLLAKDSALALQQARQHGLGLPVGEAAAAHFAAAVAAGFATADDAALFDALRARLGVSDPPPPAAPAAADPPETAP